MSNDARSAAPDAPRLEYFATITAHVAVPIELGEMPGGAQRIIPITGGTLSGPDADGTILPGGADHQVLRSSTTTQLLARYAIETDDGDRIAVENIGVRNGSEADIATLVAGGTVPSERIYFRCLPRLTGSGRWTWLSDRLFVGTGTRHPDRVEVDVFMVA